MALEQVPWGTYAICVAATALMGWFLWRSWRDADD